MDIGIAGELGLCIWINVLHTMDRFAVDGKACYLALPEIENDGLQVSTLRVNRDLSSAGDLPGFEVDIEVNDLMSDSEGRDEF